jgi:hypothetical protein
MSATDRPGNSTGSILRNRVVYSAYRYSRIRRASNWTPRPTSGLASPSALRLYSGDAITATKSASRTSASIQEAQSCRCPAAARSILSSTPWPSRNSHNLRTASTCSAESPAYDKKSRGGRSADLLTLHKSQPSSPVSQDLVDRQPWAPGFDLHHLEHAAARCRRGGQRPRANRT